jgi:hypothetical protein
MLLDAPLGKTRSSLRRYREILVRQTCQRIWSLRLYSLSQVRL